MNKMPYASALVYGEPEAGEPEDDEESGRARVVAELQKVIEREGWDIDWDGDDDVGLDWVDDEDM